MSHQLAHKDTLNPNISIIPSKVDYYVIVMVPLSGSGLILISNSEFSASMLLSVTLKNLNLSKASLALLPITDRE